MTVKQAASSRALCRDSRLGPRSLRRSPVFALASLLIHALSPLLLFSPSLLWFDCMHPRRTSDAADDAEEDDDKAAFLAQRSSPLAKRSHPRPRTKRDVQRVQRAWEARSLRKVCPIAFFVKGEAEPSLNRLAQGRRSHNSSGDSTDVSDSSESSMEEESGRRRGRRRDTGSPFGNWEVWLGASWSRPTFRNAR